MKFIKKLHKLQSAGFKGAGRMIARRLKAIPRDFLFTRGFTFFEKLGIHVLPIHYYSPIPDTRSLRRNYEQWKREWHFKSVNFNIEGQIELVEKLNMYSVECNKLPSYSQVATEGYGEGYGQVESHILHSMIRHFKPENIIEVGSGISTFFSVNALSLNQKENGINSKIVSIEPYPRQSLDKIEGECEIEIIPKLVQNINPEFFRILNERDILFIDSSHMVKINSDVNYLYLEVLPQLRGGVIVHLHDIPFPYLTPNSDHWIFEKHQFWTEAALVKAFLMYNQVFQVLLCSSYLHYKMPDILESAFNIYDPSRHFPSSLWIKKSS